MAVRTFNQPDSSVQTGAQYKQNIDDSIKVLANIADQFAPHPAGTPNMTVLVDAGALFVLGALTPQNQQTVSGFVATASTQRIDRVVGDLITGAASRVAGVESGSPVAPAIPAGKFPICQVGPFQTSTIAITNSMITDERVLLVPAVGKETVWVPAGAIMPRGTSGPTGPNSNESATNKVNYRSLDFAQSVQTFAQFHAQMPKSWNQGTVTASAIWAANSASGNSVVWGFSAVALRDGVAIDQARGTAQEVTKANNGTLILNAGPESAAITIAGSPQASDWVLFEIYRKGSGSDTLAATASLIGVRLLFTDSSVSDD